jgi:hypothetical protein
VRETPMAGLLAVTFAFGTRAPEESFTVPKIVPDVTCPTAVAHDNAIRIASISDRYVQRRNIIFPSYKLDSKELPAIVETAADSLMVLCGDQGIFRQ